LSKATPKVTLRSCHSCRGSFDRKDLIRFTRDHKSGQWSKNEEGKTFGRSLYLCRNEECQGKARKNKKQKEIIKLLEEINNKN